MGLDEKSLKNTDIGGRLSKIKIFSAGRFIVKIITGKKIKLKKVFRLAIGEGNIWWTYSICT